MSTLAAKLCSRSIPKGSAASSTTPALLDAAFACLDVDKDKGQGQGQGQDQAGGGGGGNGNGNGGELSDLFAKPGMPPSGRGEILLLLLNALRNASFVPSNERCIGHSSRAVQVGEGRGRAGDGARARACVCACVCVCTRVCFVFCEV